MPILVDLIRWYIRTSPIESRKAALGRWASRRIDRAVGRHVYDGIAGVARMELDLGNDDERSMYLNLVDRMPLRVLRRVLRPGDVFVDAGANLGLFTVVAARLVGPTGRVYAFEPQPDILARLVRNIDANDTGNVTLIPKGLWERPGEMTLHLFEGDHACTASLGRDDTRAVRDTATIPTTRLDDEVPPAVRLIKMDVEGADWQALRGGVRLLTGAPPPHLILEVNDRAAGALGYRSIEMIDWLLARAPYRMTLLERKRTRPITRDALPALIDGHKRGYFNLWLDPGA